MNGSRVLCVAHDFPVPVDNGSSARVLGFLRVLGDLAPVRLVVRRRPTTTKADIAALRAVPGVTLLDLPSSFRPRFGRAGLWSRAILRRTPPWFAAWYDPTVEAAVREHLAWATHVVALDDFAAQYLPAVRTVAGDTVLVADKHMVYASPDAWGPRPSGPAAPIRTCVLRWLATTNERRVLESADRVIVTSPEEAARLATLHGRHADAVVPTAVEPPPEAWSPPSARGTALYLGNLTHGPNRHGVEVVLDAMRAAGADFGLVVVGKGVDAQLRDRAAGLDVTFAGFVDELHDVVATAGVAIVPLWSGAGIRVKLLDLLGTGLPVVVTPAALEAVDAVAGVHCRVADTGAAMVDAVASLLGNPIAAAELGRAGRALVLEQHTWPARRAPLAAAVGLELAGASA